MRIAVEFNHYSCLCTVEVDDEIPDARLSTKLHASRPVAKLPPKRYFCQGHSAPQFFTKMPKPWVIEKLFHSTRSRDSLLPLPLLREEGNSRRLYSNRNVASMMFTSLMEGKSVQMKYRSSL